MIKLKLIIEKIKSLFAKKEKFTAVEHFEIKKKAKKKKK
jgi:hypothetical protein